MIANAIASRASPGMRRIFATVVLVLGLGYVVALIPLPWTAESGGVDALYLQQSWFLGLALLLLNLVGAYLLFRGGKGWSILALSYSLIQVAIWWLLSGLLAMDDGMAEFWGRKTGAVRMLLQHPDFKVVFVTVHQDIIIGVFYHLAFLCFLIYVLLNWNHQTRAGPRFERTGPH